MVEYLGPEPGNGYRFKFGELQSIKEYTFIIKFSIIIILAIKQLLPISIF